MSLNIRDLSFCYKRRNVLKDVNINGISQGIITSLLGPNAAGKSTFFRCLSGLLKPQSGNIILDEQDLLLLSPKQKREYMSYMPQNSACNAALTVFEVILIAKIHTNIWRVNERDLDEVEYYLKKFNIEDIANRYISELSGGQQQIVSICQTLIRPAKVYLLDEPTSALDLKHQLEIMHILNDFAYKKNIIMLVALHDINLAARFAKSLLLMRDGRTVNFGDTLEILNSTSITETYGVHIELIKSKNNITSVIASL